MEANESDVDSECENPCNDFNRTKKRPVMGRMRDVKKKILAAIQKIGKNCNCVRFECFKHISENQKKGYKKL